MEETNTKPLKALVISRTSFTEAEAKLLLQIKSGNAFGCKMHSQSELDASQWVSRRDYVLMIMEGLVDFREYL